MKKQAYKIAKADWVVTIKNGNHLGTVRYSYFQTAKEAKAFMKTQSGTRQLFKVSYEFRDVMG